jgi:hypothetical protein
LKSIKEFHHKTGNFISLFPAAFYFPLRLYSIQKGLVSQNIHGCLSGKKNCFITKKPEIMEIMKSRIDLMNAHALFYKENEIQIEMVHKYYGYNPSLPENREYRWSLKNLVKNMKERRAEIRNASYLDSALLNSGFTLNRCGKFTRIFRFIIK